MNPTDFNELFFLAQQAAGNADKPGMSDLLFMMLPLIGIFYFLSIRPAQQKRKKHEALISSVATGDNAVTVGGVHGRVAGVQETTVTLKIADNTKVKFDKSSIARVEKKGGGKGDSSEIANDAADSSEKSKKKS